MSGFEPRAPRAGAMTAALVQLLAVVLTLTAAGVAPEYLQSMGGDAPPIVVAQDE